MKIPVEIGGQIFILVFEGFSAGEIDSDQLTKIDHSNLYGEAISISALVNQVGLLATEAERVMDKKKFEVDVEEARLDKLIRKNAVANQIKVTETSIKSEILLDKAYQNAMYSYLSAKAQFGRIDSLYRAVKSKDNKLNNMIRGVTPAELVNELVEGTINNILIKRHKSITSPQR